MVQKFVENIFEKHIDWVALIQNDDNYKNILQVKIQKEFKVTPHYLEVDYDADNGYKMGVYLCLGQPIYNVKCEDAITFADGNKGLKTFAAIQEYRASHGDKIFLYLGGAQHKIKRKAEQMACKEALDKIEMYLS